MLLFFEGIKVEVSSVELTCITIDAAGFSQLKLFALELFLECDI
jgi:hypothetical protein